MTCSCLVVKKGRTDLNTLAAKRIERAKNNMSFSFLCLFYVAVMSCLCLFYCLYQWLQTVQSHFFLKFSNVEAGVLSQNLWYHSLHWLHCAISYFSSVSGTYGTRGIRSTILHLKSQYHILQLLQLLWEIVLVILFLGIQLDAV